MNPEEDIKPEQQLLIRLSRIKFDGQQKAEAEAMCKKGISWDYFCHSANMHGLSALAFNNLEKTGLLKYVPEHNSEYLRKASYLSMVRNTGIMKNLSEALSILGKENFRIVLLKGMALELMDYGNTGLRQMTDADVLLRKDEGIKAFRLLKKNGFSPLPVKSFFHKLIIKHIGKHFPSLLKDDFSLEIHHDLFGSRNKHLTSLLLETSIRSDLDGNDVWLPEPLILFLYLVHHLYRHETNNDSQLRLYTDLVVMIEEYSTRVINPQLLRLSDEAGMNRILADRLLALREYWKIEFPGWMNEFIDKNKSEEAASRFIFFLNSPKNNIIPDRSHSYRPLLNEIPGFHRKIIYVAGDLFPTLSFMKKRYNCTSAWKAILHYPHRFGKLLWLFRDYRK
jgi:hypothetical protein